MEIVSCQTKFRQFLYKQGLGRFLQDSISSLLLPPRLLIHITRGANCFNFLGDEFLSKESKERRVGWSYQTGNMVHGTMV